jgi:hypothetical protein
MAVSQSSLHIFLIDDGFHVQLQRAGLTERGVVCIHGEQ